MSRIDGTRPDAAPDTKEYAAPARRGPAAVVAAAPAHRRAAGFGRARAGAAARVRGPRRRRQGRGDQARRASRSTRGTTACRRSPSRRSTRSGTTSCGASTTSCPASAGCPCSTAAGTAGCSSSASRGSPPTDQWGRAFEEIVNFERLIVLEGVILVKFWLHISDDEQLRRFEARQADAAAALEDHRGGLAQPQAQPRVRRRRRGDVRAHRPPPRAVEPHRRRPEEVRPGARDGGAQRARRAGHAALGLPRPLRPTTWRSASTLSE